MKEIKMFITDKKNEKYWEEQPALVKPQDDLFMC